MESMNSIAGNYTITSWPSSAPLENENHIISIVCGNTHLHWSFHKGVKDDVTPSLFWRTPPLKFSDFKKDADVIEVLARHLPQYVHDFVFGDTKEATMESAKQKQLKDNRPELSVYLLSTVAEQTRYVSHMWTIIPCRIFLMKGDDFFTKAEGRYDGMGMDRLATLRGAAEISGFPALVFDGGTAWTYTAADNNGQILGGGIGPGMNLKFLAMNEYTDVLPKISPTTVTERVKTALKKNPISMFSLNTQESMINTVLSEFSLHTSCIIKNWIKTVGKDKVANSSENDAKPISSKINRSRAVFITGGDSETLTNLLRNGSEQIFGHDEISRDFLDKNQCEIRHQKHLIHYGIASAIMKQIEKIRESNGEPPKEKTPNYLGARVAKEFTEPDKDNDHIFRGSVVAVKRESNNYLYLIRYDDDDAEHVNLAELSEMMRFFLQVGEKKGKGKDNDKGKASKDNDKGKASKDNDTFSPKVTKKKPKSPLGKKTQPTEIVSSQKRKAIETAVEPEAKKVAKKIVGKTLKGKKPKDYIKSRIAKWFDTDLYFGTVTSYDPKAKLWKIVYDDDDQEELDKKEIEEALLLHKKMKMRDPELKNRENPEEPPILEGSIKNDSDNDVVI